MNQKRSDFYLPKYRLIIEIDGVLGHEGGRVHSKSKDSLKELVEIDKWKVEQHKLHGLNTIRVKCFKSNKEYITNSLINGELKSVFDLSKINWEEGERFALKNRVKFICGLWNKDDNILISNMKKKYGLHESEGTICTYLNKGSELGWCKYDGAKMTRISNGKAVDIF